MRYIALLRGINVGGNNTVSMATLKERFELSGYTNVSTYINSGNVLFDSKITDPIKLRMSIEKLLKTTFKLELTVVVVETERYKKIIKSAPVWWGKDESWKHNIIFLIEPYVIEEIVEEIGELKPDIEAMKSGDGVLFQSVDFAKFGKTTTGKLASKAVYKKMTIRNYNTAQKLLGLINKASE